MAYLYTAPFSDHLVHHCFNSNFSEIEKSVAQFEMAAVHNQESIHTPNLVCHHHWCTIIFPGRVDTTSWRSWHTCCRSHIPKSRQLLHKYSVNTQQIHTSSQQSHSTKELGWLECKLLQMYCNTVTSLIFAYKLVFKCNITAISILADSP